MVLFLFLEDLRISTQPNTSYSLASGDISPSALSIP